MSSASPALGRLSGFQANQGKHICCRVFGRRDSALERLAFPVRTCRTGTPAVSETRRCRNLPARFAREPATSQYLGVGSAAWRVQVHVEAVPVLVFWPCGTGVWGLSTMLFLPPGAGWQTFGGLGGSSHYGTYPARLHVFV